MARMAFIALALLLVTSDAHAQRVAWDFWPNKTAATMVSDHQYVASIDGGPLSVMLTPECSDINAECISQPLGLDPGNHTISVAAWWQEYNAWSEPTSPLSFTVQQTVTAPPPGENWLRCASESEFCVFTGTSEVAYGKDAIWVYKTLVDGTQCSNDVFGDPIPGTVKECWYRPSSAPDPEPEPEPEPEPTPTGCTTGGFTAPIGAILTHTMKNGEADSWIMARESEGWDLVKRTRVKNMTTVEMRCGG